jgi:hypothetical protein
MWSWWGRGGEGWGGASADATSPQSLSDGFYPRSCYVLRNELQGSDDGLSWPYRGSGQTHTHSHAFTTATRYATRTYGMAPTPRQSPRPATQPWLRSAQRPLLAWS